MWGRGAGCSSWNLEQIKFQPWNVHSSLKLPFKWLHTNTNLYWRCYAEQYYGCLSCEKQQCNFTLWLCRTRLMQRTHRSPAEHRQGNGVHLYSTPLVLEMGSFYSRILRTRLENDREMFSSEVKAGSVLIISQGKHIKTKHTVSLHVVGALRN